MAASRATDGELKSRAGATLLPQLANSDDSDGEWGFAAALVERWLSGCPSGPIASGPDARQVLTALAEGWSSTAIHTAATRTLSAVEAGEMARVGLLARVPGEEGEARFAPTRWLRRAIGPLAVAAQLEIAEPPEDAAPIDPLDVEAAFRLSLPLVRNLPEEISSQVRLIVPFRPSRIGLAGVVVLVEQGEITSISTDLSIWSETFASGPSLAWIETLIDPTNLGLDVNGDLEILLALIGGLHDELFGESRDLAFPA